MDSADSLDQALAAVRDLPSTRAGGQDDMRSKHTPSKQAMGHAGHATRRMTGHDHDPQDTGHAKGHWTCLWAIHHALMAGGPYLGPSPTNHPTTLGSG